MERLLCTKCLKYKPVERFCKQKTFKRRRAYWCKDCYRLIVRRDYRRTAKYTQGGMLCGSLGMSGVGRKYEKLALSILPGSIDMNSENFHHLGYDIKWNGKNIDVKSKEYNPHRSKAWVFNLYHKDNSDIDYFLLFCLRNKKIEKILFVPNPRVKMLVIANKSKYDKFRMFLNNGKIFNRKGEAK